MWVFFKSSKIEPYLFFWKNRAIKVDKINLTHTSRDGLTTFHHFSISSGSNFYRLKLDSKNLKWFLEEVEEDIK